jgi:hypothetical protein
MTMLLALCASALLGGLGRRVAGGGFQQWTGIDVGDYPARAFFGLTLAVSAAVGGTYNWGVPLLVLSTFLGCSIPMAMSIMGVRWGGMALGRDGGSWRRSAIGLTGHGVLSMAITAVPLCYFGGHWAQLLIAGVLIVPAYEIGWDAIGTKSNTHLPPGFQGGSEIGEVLWGSLCGIAACGVHQ